MLRKNFLLQIYEINVMWDEGGRLHPLDFMNFFIIIIIIIT